MTITKLAGLIDARDFGAVCDQTTNDRPAIQAAVAHLEKGNYGGGAVMVPGPSLIDGPIEINRSSVELLGWNGFANPAVGGSALLWGGVAGDPMVRLVDTYGAAVRKIRMLGDDNAQPSAGVELVFTGADPIAPYSNQSVSISDMTIGPHSFGQSGQTGMMERGIMVSGTVDQDRLLFTNLEVSRASAVGIDILDRQATWSAMVNVLVQGADTRTPIGMRLRADCTLVNPNINRCGTAFEIARGAGVNIQSLGSEHCNKLADIANQAVVQFTSGYFQMTDVVAGQPFVDCPQLGAGGGVHFDGLEFRDPWPVGRATLSFGQTQPSGTVRARDCQGLGAGDFRFAIGPAGQISASGSFFGEAGDFINDLRGGELALRSDRIEAANRLGARDAGGVMRYLLPPAGPGPATWI